MAILKVLIAALAFGLSAPLAKRLLDTVPPGQLSVALTLNVTLLLQAPGAALTLIFVGQVICGT